jgi:hypothetical protein
VKITSKRWWKVSTDGSHSLDVSFFNLHYLSSSKIV